MLFFPLAEIEFASYYSDEMVLQAAPERPVVWGTAPESFIGRTLTLSVVIDGFVESIEVEIEKGSLV